MLDAETLEFLKQLKANNNRQWFERNRKAYEAARNDFIRLVDAWIGGLADFDPRLAENEPLDSIFRIHRDFRFAREKIPYKTNFGAFVSDRGRRISRAGYYLHVEPGQCLFAGGLYLPPGPELKAVRRAIAEDYEELRRIIDRPSFVKLFGKGLSGDSLKTAPRDYRPDHPAIDLLRLKSYEVWRDFPDDRLLRDDFVAFATRICREMHDYNVFLNKALDRYLPPPPILSEG